MMIPAPGRETGRIQGKVHDLIQYSRVMTSKIYWKTNSAIKMKFSVSVRDFSFSVPTDEHYHYNLDEHLKSATT